MPSQAVNTLAPPPTPDWLANHPTWFRLVDQRTWYDRKSQSCQRSYKWIKVVQVTLAVLVPATSLLPSEPAKVTASVFGVLIAVLEAVQQMNQYATLWVTYRATAERLKHEEYLFLASAGPYRGLDEGERIALLAERVEEHVSTEHANWFNEARDVARMRQPERSATPSNSSSASPS